MHSVGMGTNFLFTNQYIWKIHHWLFHASIYLFNQSNHAISASEVGLNQQFASPQSLQQRLLYCDCYFWKLLQSLQHRDLREIWLFQQVSQNFAHSENRSRFRSPSSRLVSTIEHTTISSRDFIGSVHSVSDSLISCPLSSRRLYALICVSTCFQNHAMQTLIQASHLTP